MKQPLTIPICTLLFSPPMYAAPCGIHGIVQERSREHPLNRFKKPAINPSILKRLARRDTFQNTQAAAAIGYVALVKPGGKETCNRKAKDAAHKHHPVTGIKVLRQWVQCLVNVAFRRRLQPRTNET